MSYSDTTEQAAVIGWSGHRLVVRAFAGTGKTSTLVRFARANPDIRMLYLAYNRAVRDEAEQKFPFNVECKTSHQLAWPNFGRHYQERLTGNLRITDVARQLNTRHWPLARTAITTFNAFLCSGDSEFGPQHLPDEDARSGLSAEKILAAAQQLWRESARQDGTFPVTHDVYLKLYQLSHPDLSKRWQTLLFDEAQDANPVIQSLILTQRCNVVLVGDRHQQIYRFRGAENALDAPGLSDAERLNLTHSFRFGLAVASVANMLLARQGETLPVVGDGGRRGGHSSARRVSGRARHGIKPNSYRRDRGGAGCQPGRTKGVLGWRYRRLQDRGTRGPVLVLCRHARTDAFAGVVAGVP